MGKKVKKGTSGNAVQYMTRNQALKKLQLPLALFRRLCILKGIHPREPRKKTQGQGKTYYHTKDILFLAHEPLLNKYRASKVYERKIRKARAKRNDDLARRLMARRPNHRLDHLVKERYPSFVDALRDLDDALTLIHLFAVLPAEQRHKIPNSAVQTSRRLALEWQAYVVRTHALRKVFVSVKGFYYQAEIMGQPITWLVPHQLGQVLPNDVDYRVMLTFLEFYQTLLQFVNFKLYHHIGVTYPPVVDPRMEQAAAGLAAIMEDLAQTSKPTTSTDAEKPLDAEALRRLETLQDKLRKVQEEEAGGSAAEPSADAHPVTAQAPDGEGLEAPEKEEEEDEEQLGIDSGEGSSSDSEEEAGPEPGPGSQLALAEITDATVSTASAMEDDSEAAARSVVGGALGVDAEDEAAVCGSLFRGLVFFLGREVPREQLLVVIKAFGGAVGWEGEGSPLREGDESITHQVVDRPAQGHKFLSREYVQPQWLLDSANFRVLPDSRLYAPGAAPPPHLSPFVDAEDEGYVPEYLATLKKLQETAKAMRQRAQGLAQDTAFLEEAPVTTATDPAADTANAEQLYQAELAKELKAKRKAQDAELEGEGSEDEAEEVVKAPAAKRQATVPAEVEEADEEAMKKATMKRRDRHLYQAILNKQKAKRQRVLTLQQKRDAGAQGR